MKRLDLESMGVLFYVMTSVHRKIYELFNLFKTQFPQMEKWKNGKNNDVDKLLNNL